MKLIDKIANSLGDVVFSPLAIAGNQTIPFFVFNSYSDSNKWRIERQVCQSLSEAGLIAAHHYREYIVFRDIYFILFCQTLLEKEGEFWGFFLSSDESIDRQMKLKKCWKRFEELDITTLFEYQWRFLKRLSTKNLTRNLLLFKSLYKNTDIVPKESITAIKFLETQRYLWGLFLTNKNMDDFRYSYYHSNIIEQIQENTRIRYVTSNKEYLILPGYQTIEPFDFYIELLQCIDKATIRSFLHDCLSNVPPYHGVPDIITYDRQSKEYILLECKTKKDFFHGSQITWFQRNAEFYGFKVGVVVTSHDQIDKLKATEPVKYR
ncbi:MAG: VRR-NUC domain-containing protein [Nitrospiraceae bacterium]|nr:VRR-NUC domain-containing protein [Nitrospiraceae bacterium]